MSNKIQMQFDDIRVNKFEVNDGESSDSFNATFITSKPDKFIEMNVGGINVARYRNNSVVLFGHDHSQVIGTVSNLGLSGDGQSMNGTIKLSQKTQLARDTLELVKEGTLKGISIGIEFGMDDVDVMGEKNDMFRINKSELLEVSLVSVPRDRNALIETFAKEIKMAQSPDTPVVDKNETALKLTAAETAIAELQTGVTDAAKLIQDNKVEYAKELGELKGELESERNARKELAKGFYGQVKSPGDGRSALSWAIEAVLHSKFRNGEKAEQAMSAGSKDGLVIKKNGTSEFAVTIDSDLQRIRSGEVLRDIIPEAQLLRIIPFISTDSASRVDIPAPGAVGFVKEGTTLTEQTLAIANRPANIFRFNAYSVVKFASQETVHVGLVNELISQLSQRAAPAIDSILARADNVATDALSINDDHDSAEFGETFPGLYYRAFQAGSSGKINFNDNDQDVRTNLNRMIASFGKRLVRRETIVVCNTMFYNKVLDVYGLGSVANPVQGVRLNDDGTFTINNIKFIELPLLEGSTAEGKFSSGGELGMAVMLNPNAYRWTSNTGVDIYTLDVPASAGTQVLIRYGVGLTGYHPETADKAIALGFNLA